MHVGAHRGRAADQRGAARLYLLLLRVASRSGRFGGVLASGHDRRVDDDGHGHIQLYRRRIFGKFKSLKVPKIKGGHRDYYNQFDTLIIIV